MSENVRMERTPEELLDAVAHQLSINAGWNPDYWPDRLTGAAAEIFREDASLILKVINGATPSARDTHESP